MRYVPERAAWAGLAIWVGGKNLCLHVDPDELDLREHLHVPLGPLADWLARARLAITFEERAARFATSRSLHRSVRQWGEARRPANTTEDDWVDDRETWWSRHFLQAGAEGAYLPNLALARDDEELVLDWESPYWAGEESLLALHPRGNHAIPWYEGVDVMREFVRQVGEWIEAEVGKIYEWLEGDALDGTLTERAELFSGRSIERLVEVLALEHGLQDLGLDEEDDPAASPELQVLRDLSPLIPTDASAVLRELGDRSKVPNDGARLARNQARALARDAARGGRTPEEAGQEAALHLRRSLGLDSQSIPAIDPILDRIGLAHSHFDVPSNRDRLMVLTRSNGLAAAGTLRTVRTEKPWGQRFEAARAAGHVLLDPEREGAIGAAAGPFAQRTRRRRSGAFAAELLLPEAALSSASGEVLDGAAEDDRFQALMTEYGVGARTAAFQLWNRRWLSSPEMRDELIDRFATVQWG